MNNSINQLRQQPVKEVRSCTHTRLRAAPARTCVHAHTTLSRMRNTLLIARDTCRSRRLSRQSPSLCFSAARPDPTFGSATRCSTLWLVQRVSDSTTLDGVTKITKDNAPQMPLPSLCAYQSAASRGPESVPALFYRQMMGEAWDGKAHSYSLATKKFRRLLPAYQRDVQEREHRRKHALATAKPAAPISSPECANAPAAATAAAASAAESTAVCATSPQPRRYEPRFQGDYKAFRKADNAWHERARRKRLRHK